MGWSNWTLDLCSWVSRSAVVFAAGCQTGTMPFPLFAAIAWGKEQRYKQAVVPGSSAQSSTGRAVWATHPFPARATSSRLPLACGPHLRPCISTEVFGVHLSLLPDNFQAKATSESWLRGAVRQSLHGSWPSTSFIPARDVPETTNVPKPATAKRTGSLHSA